MLRASSGLAAKRRIREYYQWPNIALEIERVYLETMGRELNEPPAKKPSGSVREALAAQRKAG
jgi:hypothetical protein